MALTPLSSSTTASLNAVQRNQALEERHLGRLSSGRAVNSIRDNPQAYVLASGLLERAGSLSEVGRSIGQAFGALDAAQNGLEAISKVVNQLKGIAAQAEASGDPAEQARLQGQYNALRGQVDTLATDASYNGTNLIAAAPGKLTVQGISGGSTTTIQGTASDAAALGVTAAAGWSGNIAAIQADRAALDQAQATLRSTSASLGSNTNSLRIQADAVQSQAAIARDGANRLTAADSTEAAASAQAAHTYRRLGLAALRNDIQGQEHVLTLFARR